MKILLTLFFLLFLLTEYSSAQIPESDQCLRYSSSDEKTECAWDPFYISLHIRTMKIHVCWPGFPRTNYIGQVICHLTRGDGGQNLIGDEQGIELGLIRTQELMAARRIDGADQFFSRAYDFGFSKTTAESLKIWNEQKILSDVVWIIRKFQPDIIITRFPEDKRAGHGQHSASSVLARLAYTAAADPKQFPEQFTYGVQSLAGKENYSGTITISERSIQPAKTN